MPNSRSKSSRKALRSAAPRLLVGLMAGTSLDGVDAALMRLTGPPTAPRFRLLKMRLKKRYPRYAAMFEAAERRAADLSSGRAFRKARDGLKRRFRGAGRR